MTDRAACFPGASFPFRRTGPLRLTRCQPPSAPRGFLQDLARKLEQRNKRCATSKRCIAAFPGEVDRPRCGCYVRCNPYPRCRRSVPWNRAASNLVPPPKKMRRMRSRTRNRPAIIVLQVGASRPLVLCTLGSVLSTLNCQLSTAGDGRLSWLFALFTPGFALSTLNCQL